MSFAQFFVACCLAIVLLAVSNTRAAVQGPPLCQSGIVEEMPPHIRKVKADPRGLDSTIFDGGHK